MVKMNMVKQIFVNLPVKDLGKSKEFWTKLGFTFNPQFTDEKGAGMNIGDNIYAMLLTEPFFKTFTKKEIGDPMTTAQVINALSVESREKVDEIARKAVESGGKIHREPQDYGWMYGQSIEDPDGHIWEFFYMDESKKPKH